MELPVYLYKRILLKHTAIVEAFPILYSLRESILYKGLQWFLLRFVQVAELRQRFFHSISPGGLAGDRRGVVPASGFSFSAQQIWKVIKENKDLDLPAHKVCWFRSLSEFSSWF